jgi:hypothetical protein
MMIVSIDNINAKRQTHAASGMWRCSLVNQGSPADGGNRNP